MERVLPVFRRLQRKVRRSIDPDFSVGLALGPDEHFPEPRNMAYCMYDDDMGTLCIVVSRKLCQGEDGRIEGVMRHEFGHAILLFNNVKHGERDADTVAEQVFGDPIYYDKQTVQTIHGGTRPRPTHLGR